MKMDGPQLGNGSAPKLPTREDVERVAERVYELLRAELTQMQSRAGRIGERWR